MAAQKMHSAKKKRMINNVIVHVSLAVLAAIWVFPIVWVILTSFAAGAVLISIPIAILFLIMQRYYVDGVSGAVKG